MFYTVYQTTNNVNGKIYVGVHKTANPEDSYLGSGRHIKLAIKKHGKQNFFKKVLFTFENIKDAYIKEAEIVNREFVSRPDTYNMVCGGCVSPDRDPNKPRKILKGKDHPHFGKKHSEERKRQISLSSTGRVKSEETRKKLSMSNKGRVSPMKGKTLTDEDKAKKSLSAKNKVKVKCIHCDIIADPGNIALFHNENCKNSPFFTEEMRLERAMKRSVPKNQKQKTCPHCNLEGKGPNMTRYHFDNCKNQ